MIKTTSQMLLVILFLTSCLKTRTEISEQDQNIIYGKKNVENQMDAQVANTGLATAVNVDEKDELIRSLNGRVETLENQLAQVIKEKELTTLQDVQKMSLVQDSITQLELKIQKLETDLPINKTNEKALNNIESSDEAAKTANTKKMNTYETAQYFFTKQEWKKAILNFQKYTDESPKGKLVSDAKYKIGVCFQELGMKDEAMAFYEEVVANYAKTEVGKKSKLRLTQLKK